MVEIYYEDWQKPVFFTFELADWLENLCEKEDKELIEISLIFCSDNYLLEKNREILDHDYFTDIITLDYCIDNQVIGDLFVSLDRVKENAVNVESTFEDELSRVVAHGTLHLCGYGDKSPQEIKEMRAKEDFYLSLRP
jgi:rRNA maturation RNase YbeY